MSSIPKPGISKRTCLLLLMAVMSSYVFGKQIPTVTGILKTDPSFSPFVTIGAVNTILVPVVSGTKDYNVRNTVSLKYDLNTDTFFLAPVHVRVRVSINRWDVNNNPMPSLIRRLSVRVDNKLNRPILEESMVNLVDGYKITMTLDSIWVNGVLKGTLPRYVSLESAINMDRYYDFTVPGNTVPANTQILASDRDCDGTLDELQVSWSVPTAVPEEYQLEWTFVSNYSANGGSYPASVFTTDFKNNSTRITTTANSYKVTMLYPDGYIVFRVRAVGRNYLNPSEYMYGAWNLADQVNVGSLSSPYWYTIAGHEKGKNWQYSATFAEEGKSKEVVSYFDGSLYNRQTVTKLNSDKNTLVGESMYDYQGRPAINVLPVPVNFTCVTVGAEPVIKYYNKFNIDDTNKVYSRNDFDLDGTGVCVSSVAPMDTTSGASMYYSSNNPNKNQQQGYLPHAKKYPFTQIEYTPDNTGRIRKQSGLGSDYKLGSGKELRYLYGQPNQLQVDRLFGSEAGDASHYKKNVTIDANGQVNVTYLDMEGRTIASALAGVPPTIGQSTTTRLDSLDYAGQGQTQYTVDLFNKNSLGVSNLNIIPPSNDQLAFSTQLLVPFRSSYEFKYTLNIDVLQDPCLKQNVCVSCVYDMEIHVTDECGADLVPTVSPFKTIKRVTGNVDTTNNKLTFNTNCLNPTLFTDQAGTTLVLDPGVYTVSKVLKVNQKAKDYYVQKYTDSVYNSCVMTLHQFQAAELATVDTSDCYNSCSSCVTALGAKDDFVSAGKGTAEQWEFLLQQCNEPCRQKTLCQVTYELMLSDVSPGGQYGKFNQLTYDASAEPLSVYNMANALNPNNIPSQQANWRNPLMRLNGNMYQMYMDENGVRTRINVTQVSPGVYQPPVNNPSLVYLDNVTNLQYTYPENLLNLSDFISNWNSNFAKSLVVFHPEYAYYVSCSDQAVVFPGDTRSSDNLDSLLFATESFNQAVTAGFIKSNYLTVTPPTSRVNTIWLTPSGAYDPFFTNSNFQYSTTFNSVTGAQTSTNMAGGAPYNINLQTEMNTIITNYRTIGANVYSMVDIAAIITRCGNNFGTAVPAALCADFGKDFYVSPPYPGANDTVRNKEWRVFRQLYFSEKQKLQFKRMNFYAKYCNDLYSNYYGGCNACIGNTAYDVFNSGMVTFNGAIPDLNSPFFDTSQPCGATTYLNYPGVVKRFYDPANTGLNTNSAAQQIYQATGQCPLAFELQNFLNAMAASASLTPNSISLNQVSEFTPDLYSAVSSGGMPTTFINYSWQPSISGTTLTANIVDPNTSTTKCVIKLDITGTSIPTFANITSISQLLYDATGVGNGAFKAVAVYTVGGVAYSANIKGSSSCMDIKSCGFTEQCSANQFASDMSNLFSYLQASGSLGSTSPVALSSNATYSLLLTPSIKNTLGSPNSNIVYQFVSPDKLTVYDSGNPSTKLVFTYTVTPASAASNIKSFAAIRSNYSNLYNMEGRDVNGVKIATIDGAINKATSTQTTGISAGTCGLPDPVECSEKEHKVRKDLEGLVNEILSTKPFNNNVNIYTLASFSNLLKSYESATVNATSSTYTSGTTASPNFDTLTIRFTTTPANTYSTCNFKLYHYRNNSTVLNFANIVSVTNLTGIGVPNLANNYFYFKALATYVVGTNPPVTDTIYGYSCWPIKNCNYCQGVTVTNTIVNTYTYSTAFNRASNLPYNNSNNGSNDPYWTVYRVQGLDATYTPTGSPTFPGTLAYDIAPLASSLPIAGAGYINMYPTSTSAPNRQAVTYRTTFNLPNPLSPNRTYSLIVTTRADDAIFTASVNGTSKFSGVSGGAYGGSAVNFTVTSLTGLIPGTNTLDIEAADLGLSVFGMIAGVTVVESYTQQLCNNGPPDSTFVFPPYTKYDNPCVRQKKNLAMENAANKYQQYINDIITTFADAYTKHCLAALETFTYKYVDKEYHHTLYYYDQAGNLIKTIPPEGVEYLPITAYNSSLEMQINNDRTIGQQSVFTNHRMASKYVYNSLNQMIFQSIPDHDNMGICDGLNPNGLDTGLVINAIQFVNANKGYLCGHLKNTGPLGFNRGYVYTSNDGGNYWTRVKGVTSGNLQKVQYVTPLNGFAVSDFGMVFKTTDGGITWDLLTGLYNLLTGSRYVDKLTDLYFTGTFGVVGGIGQAGAPPIYYTNDGGGTFSAASVSGYAIGDTITGFTFDGSTYVASSRNGLTGKLFTSTNGINWSLVPNISANNLKRVQFISSSLAYAVGEEGTLMKLSVPISGTPVFQQVPTGMLGDINDVYFKNATDGVAIIDSVPGKGKIFKTFDGGQTWQLLSANGDYYNSLSMYDGVNHKLIAGGAKGLLAKVLLASAPFGIIKIGTPNTNPVTYAQAYNNGTNGLIAIGVSLVSPTLITSYDVQTPNPTWLSVNTTTLVNPIPAPDARFKKVIVLDSSSATPYIKGVLLTLNGKLYSFYRRYNVNTMTCWPITLPGGPGGKFFNDITANGQTFTSRIYAFDTISKRNYQITFAGTVGTGIVLNNITPVNRNVNSIDINNSGSDFMLVGNSGYIQYSPLVSTNTNWLDVSFNTIPVAITKVRAVSSNNFIASGIDGSLWKSSGGASTWYLRNSGTVENLNAMAVDNSGNGLIAARNGLLFRLTGAQTQAPLLSSITTGITANLTDVALNPGNDAYVTSNSGQVLYLSNYAVSSPVLATQVTNLSLNGVAFKNGPGASVVGNTALIANYGGTNAMVTSDLFTRGLNSIHFFDANNGFVIDSCNVIRKTSDGGATWKVVLPTQGPQLLTKIASTSANSGVLIGMKRYAAQITGTALNVLTVPGSVPPHIDFFDIGYNSTNSNGFIVGADAWACNIAGTTITDLGQAAPGIGDFHAVHTFNNNTFISCGTRGIIYYYKNGAFTSQMNYLPNAGHIQNDLTLRDIYFHDFYTGYVVGGYGSAYRVELSDSIGMNGTIANALQWNPFCEPAIYMSYSAKPQIDNLDFRAVACPSRIFVMIGGADTNIVINGFKPNRYARLLREQAGYYSTRYWYDKLGRLILSQNTKQFNKSNPADPSVKQAYSYTLYDALGRIVEVGEKFENHPPGSPQMIGIFGSFVNGYYNNNTIDDSKFMAWITSAGMRHEVTKTYYDVQSILSGSYTQKNLRKRVASSTYEDVFDGNDLTYKHATHYSYDIHGNINTLWQENTQVAVSGQSIKQIDYQYDLVAGKVNKIIYSSGQPDQFIHRYTYDADNRITMVETSSNDLHYDLDAKYFYYAHGPLARIEYGKNQVQGIDYAYTLQGWIKGVNSNTLKKAKDMGSDGDLSFTNPNGNFGRDIFGYTLNYYKGDYESINYLKWNTASTRFEAYNTSSDFRNNSTDLFNGNITSMVTSISQIDTNASGVVTGSRAFPLGSTYRYDQLNRLKRSLSYTNLDTLTNTWLSNGASIAGLYRNAFTYDANGNIRTQVKHDSIGGFIDSLTYNYETITGKLHRNRLYHVNDLVTSTPASLDDIKDQGFFTSGTSINQSNNYSFDEIGNLVKDNAEKIDTIRWTISGKISAIIRKSGSPKDNLYFDYDAGGNRVAQHIYTSARVWKSSTYYLLDTKGSVLSVYEKKVVGTTMSYKQNEEHLYGNGRIGMIRPNIEMIGATLPPDTNKSYLGHKFYELYNHLGSVLTTITDKKIPIASVSLPTSIGYYVADMISASDYYAFGSELPGRRYNASKYRYGFNGKENDDDVKGTGNQQDYGMRIYDNRLGRFFTVDPLTREYAELTPYQFASNTPVQAVDLDGLEAVKVDVTARATFLFVSVALGVAIVGAPDGVTMFVTPEVGLGAGAAIGVSGSISYYHTVKKADQLGGWGATAGISAGGWGFDGSASIQQDENGKPVDVKLGAGGSPRVGAGAGAEGHLTGGYSFQLFNTISWEELYAKLGEIAQGLGIDENTLKEAVDKAKNEQMKLAEEEKKAAANKQPKKISTSPHTTTTTSAKSKTESQPKKKAAAKTTTEKSKQKSNAETRKATPIVP